MMNNSLQILEVQPQSLGKYLEDIWIVALFLVIFQQQTVFPLPFVWVSLQVLIVCIALFTFRKAGKSQLAVFVIPIIVLLPLLLGSFWLYIFLTVFSIWRLDTRFNRLQEDQIYGSNYLLFYFLSFIGIFLFLKSMNPSFITTLYIIFISGILIFWITRILAVWSAADKRNTISTKLLSLGIGVGVVLLGSVAFMVYYLFPYLREGIGVLLEWFIKILVLIFGTPLESFIEFIKSITVEPETSQGPVGTEEFSEEEKLNTNFESPVSFSNLKWLLFGGSSLVIAAIVYFLLKRKPEILERKENPIFYENSNFTQEEDKEEERTYKSIYQIEASYLREQYIKFEQEAQLYDLERKKSETVREWFLRMSWDVEPQFFEIYEEVRYGGISIEENRAILFTQSLEKIKNKNFFKKDV